MKSIFLLALMVFTHNLWAVCSSPISRTNVGANAILTSTKYNLDANTVYNKVNNLPGDCVNDDSLNGSKLVDASVTNVKLAANAVGTSNVQDGAITAAKLAAAIENLVPVGTILPYGGASAPSGYLICNGQSISRATYASLYAVIGNSFGTADGVSFNVPDLRGRFLRMVDGGAANDPDRASRTALKTGGASGDNIGSAQDYTTAQHFHFVLSTAASTNSISSGNYIAKAFLGFNTSGSGGNNTAATEAKTSSSGGNETRPTNVNVNYIIKY